MIGAAAALLSAAVSFAPIPPEKPGASGAGDPESSASTLAVRPAPKPTGFLCRDPRLAGERMSDIIEVGALACGVEDPVRVHAIDGIVLAPPIVTGCRTARRVADWLTGVARIEARRTLDARITKTSVMGSYTCRTRNNQLGARRSEHARGRAVDIGGFTLGDGRNVTVAEDWGVGAGGLFLRAIWKKSCGPFATVLGPEADRHHHDHLHLDTSPRGGAPYCR